MSVIYNNSIPKPTFQEIKATLQLHDDITGVVKRNSDSVNFKHSQIDTYSDVATVSLNVSGVTRIKNVKLGIVRSDLIAPNGSGEVNDDGSVAVGSFGIEHSKVFTEKVALNSFFNGINSTSSPNHENNVVVGTREDTSSEFVFLTVKVSSDIQRGHVLYKWFFDFF